MKNLLFITIIYTAFNVSAQEEPKQTIIHVVESDEWEDENPSDGVYDFPQVLSDFPGGTVQMQNFIGRNIEYPKEAIEKNIQGKVYLSFIVQKKGNIRDIMVERGADPLLDKAAIEVIRKMPRWKPARVHGKKVASRVRLPIIFRLE